jgi:hypothetical protein
MAWIIEVTIRGRSSESRLAHRYLILVVRYRQGGELGNRCRTAPNVRLGSEADIHAAQSYVRLTAESVRSSHSPYLIVQSAPA